MLVTQRNISVKLYYVVGSFVILFTQATMFIPLRLGYQSEIFKGQYLMLILTMAQNFVKLPYLANTFLETSYLSVFGLCGPIIYRPGALCQTFFWVLGLPMILNIW